MAISFIPQLGWPCAAEGCNPLPRPQFPFHSQIELSKLSAIRFGVKLAAAHLDIWLTMGRPPMRDDMTRRLFAALVARAGGPDVVATLLAARYGVGTKGTVSRMCSGQIGVTVDAMTAVEDDLGAYPITEALAERRAAAPARKAAPCIRDMAARSVLAAGEAHAALIRAFAEGGDGGDTITAPEAAAIVEQMGALRDLADQIATQARRMIGGAA